MQVPRCLPCIPARYELAIIAFFGFLNVYMLRVNLSVALVAMVADNSTGGSVHGECPPSGNRTVVNKSNGPVTASYDWDRSTQGLILGSFFYGYILTQLPGGWLASKYGGKKLFGLGILCTSVFTLLTPLAASLGVPVLVATRILEGLGEGVTFPAMHAIWAVWAPPLERSKLVMLSFAGSQAGTVLGLPLSGYIADSLGWPYVFYIFGVFGVVWFILWMLFVADSPSEHNSISKEERDYITGSIASTTNQEPITFKNTPWLEMAKCPAVWALCVSFFCHNWGFYTLLTCLPTYMKDVLQFDLSQNSLLSALPYLFMWIFILLSSVAVDTAREKNYLSTVATRKIAIAMGFLVPGACLVGMGYVGCNSTLAVALLCIAGTFDGISQSGYNVNHLDIAPKYAGTLMGITNGFGTIPGMLGPQVVGWLTTNHSTSDQWRSVFLISAEIYLFGAIVFVLLARGTVQPWAIGNGYERLPDTEDYRKDCENSINNSTSSDSSATG